MLQYIVIFMILVPKCQLRCTDEDGTAQCDSIDGVRKHGAQEWTEIRIKSFGEQQNIKSNTFEFIQNIKLITFNNSVNNIEDSTFTGLYYLEELRFEKCNLPIIKKNWFSRIRNLRLIITNSNVQTLEEKCFEGSNRLNYLRITGNNITRIPANIFNGSLIKYIDLSKNQIRFIEENAFANMINLISLSVFDNLLTSFYPKFLTGETPSLEYLLVEKNRFKYLIKDHFIDLPFLKKLYLHSNELEKIYDGAFNGLTQLETLFLSFNKLDTFPEGALPEEGLESLEILYLHNNRLNYLSRNIIRYFPRLTGLSIFGNPWQCACYKQMINNILINYNNVKLLFGEEFLNGGRPVCVVPEMNSDQCTENIPRAND